MKHLLGAVLIISIFASCSSNATVNPIDEKILAKVHRWPIIADETFISELKYVSPFFEKGDIIEIGVKGNNYIIDSIFILDQNGHYTGDIKTTGTILDDDN